MISAVFFDFSGTIVDGYFDVLGARSSVASYLSSQGFYVTLESYSRSVNAVNFARVNAAKALEAETTYEAFMREVLTRLCVSETSDSFLHRIEEIEFKNYYWKLLPGAAGIICELSDRYKLGLISNALTRSAVRILKEANLLPCFETLVFSRDVGFRKPHPSIFNFAIESLGVPAGEAVFVGDNAVTDALGARSVGMNSIWISRGKSLAAKVPFLCVASDIRDVPNSITYLDSLLVKNVKVPQQAIDI
jgi:putative hydrolase of the HAD superfamily